MKRSVLVVVLLLCIVFVQYRVSGAENIDNQLPVVGAIDVTRCGFEITITDDKAVDTAATTVKVIDPDGYDVTGYITRINYDMGGSGIIKFSTLNVAGTYSVSIIACDQAGNCADAVTKNVTLTYIESCHARCLAVEPAYVLSDAGEVNISIQFSYDDFLSGGDYFEVEFGCSSIIAGEATVINYSVLNVNAFVSAADADESCNVIISGWGGYYGLACENSFQVITEMFEICDNGIDDDNDTMIDCDDTDCDDSYVCRCTDEDGDGYGVGPGCIDVDCDDTDVSVNPGEEEFCLDDGLDNDCDGDIDFGDSDCDAVLPCCEILKVSPAAIKAGRFLSKIKVVTITIDGDIERGDQLDFGDDIRVLMSVRVAPNKVIALISIPAKTEPGSVDVTVGDCLGAGIFAIR